MPRESQVRRPSAPGGAFSQAFREGRRLCSGHPTGWSGGSGRGEPSCPLRCSPREATPLPARASGHRHWNGTAWLWGRRKTQTRTRNFPLPGICPESGGSRRCPELAARWSSGTAPRGGPGGAAVSGVPGGPRGSPEGSPEAAARTGGTSSDPRGLASYRPQEWGICGRYPALCPPSSPSATCVLPPAWPRCTFLRALVWVSVHFSCSCAHVSSRPAGCRGRGTVPQLCGFCQKCTFYTSRAPQNAENNRSEAPEPQQAA